MAGRALPLKRLLTGSDLQVSHGVACCKLFGSHLGSFMGNGEDEGIPARNRHLGV